MSDQTPAEPRQRLHPLSPLLHGAKALVVIVAGLSWSTLSSVGWRWFSGLVLVLVLGAIAVSVVSWFNTGYHVVGRELRIHEGLLWRRTRAIPLERLQAVEVIRPLLAQLTGLAELRLEVVGGGKTEAPLAYLSVADAMVLRERLLGLTGHAPAAPALGGAAGPAGGGPGVGGPAGGGPGVGGPAGGGPGVGGHAGGGPGVGGPAVNWPAVGAPAPPGLELFAVSNRDLLISQLLTPQAFFLPFGLAFVVAQFAAERSWSFVAVASTLTAIAGVLLQPIRRVLEDWDFRLARDDAALRVRHGLVETRAQTVPVHRVQAIGATWPLLWRMKGWLRLRLDVAGYAGGEQNQRQKADRLLPVGDLPTARAIIAAVLPGVDLTALWLPPPPARARWVRPLSQPVLGAGLSAEVFAVRYGLLTRELLVVPFARIQSVRVVQGPLQRRLRLATVHADTAGGRTAVAHDRDLSEAWAMAAELSARARAARSRR